MPEIKFIQVDANEVFSLKKGAARPEREELYEWEPQKRQVDELRRIYQRDGKMVPKNPSKAKTAWVIDEVSVSGGTGIISQRLLEKAFPNLSVKAKVWMPISKVKSGGRGYENEKPDRLAPWYSHLFSQGRGVGETGENEFLSGHGSNDILTEALRTDIDLLARDIKEGHQSVRGFTGLNCYFKNPETGEEDLNRPRYKVSRIINNEREIKLPVTE